MIRLRHLLTALPLAVGATAARAQPPYPQTAYPAAPYAQFAPPSDADRLAQQMRAVAADPTNLYALISAAGLSLRVGDTDGAAALYTRADKIAPGNPQVKAGMARLLVNAQRPGEALRLFQEAARSGANERDFGSDRALAYDLIGEQARAQREYRSLLRQGPDDETTRRYALSLGISGLRDPALALLEPLNRRSDRGAWRVRAFVLAMNGDRAGADRIAATMMPAGMAGGLRPFFDRLPTLSATDRAFAVHFGEVRGNVTRYADLRRAPSLPALAPEPNPFPPVTRVQVAALEGGKKPKKPKRDKKLAPAVQLANVAKANAAPLPPPPTPTAIQLAALDAGRLPLAPADGGSATRGPTVLPPPPEAYRAREPQVAARLDLAAQVVTSSANTDDEGDEGPDEPVATPAAAPVPIKTAPPVQLAGNAPAVPRNFTLLKAAATPALVSSAATTSIASPPIQVSPAPVTAPSTQAPPPPTAAAPPAAPVPLPAADGAAAPLVVIGAPPPPTGEAGDTVLAAIVANIQVPTSELATTPAAAPPPAKLLSVVEKKAATKADPALKSDLPLPPKDARGRFLDTRGKPLLDPRGRPLDAKAASVWQLAQTTKPDPGLPATDARGRFVDAKGKPLLDPRGRPLDAKAAAAWQLAEAKKPDPKLPAKDARGRYVDAKGKPLLDPRGRPLDAKAAAAWKVADAKAQAEAKKKPDPAKTDPSRIWVQVAGGANEDTLGKEWARVNAQSVLLKGKSGWTTPLRATNRVLTGPFKTSGEAMTLVNQLKKQGVAAFMFTSDPGQKVTRLGAK